MASNLKREEIVKSLENKLKDLFPKSWRYYLTGSLLCTESQVQNEKSFKKRMQKVKEAQITKQYFECSHCKQQSLILED